MALECSCEDWKVSEPKLVSAHMLAWNHGIKYDGAVFRYCPWCGNKLPKETLETLRIKEGEVKHVT